MLVIRGDKELHKMISELLINNGLEDIYDMTFNHHCTGDWLRIFRSGTKDLVARIFHAKCGFCKLLIADFDEIDCSQYPFGSYNELTIYDSLYKYLDCYKQISAGSHRIGIINGLELLMKYENGESYEELVKLNTNRVANDPYAFNHHINKTLSYKYVLDNCKDFGINTNIVEGV